MRGLLAALFTVAVAGCSGGPLEPPPDADVPGDLPAAELARADQAPVIVVSDDFDDGDPAPLWMPYGGVTTVAEEGGLVTVTLPSGFDGNSYAGYESVDRHDLSRARLVMELVETPDPATHANAYLQVIVEVNVSEILWLLEAGELGCALIDAGVFSTPCSVPVDASSRWVAFELEGGQLRWLTSPDGQTWQEQASRQISFATTSSRLNFGAGVDQPETDPGLMRFDSFRIEGLQRAGRK